MVKVTAKAAGLKLIIFYRAPLR